MADDTDRRRDEPSKPFFAGDEPDGLHFVARLRVGVGGIDLEGRVTVLQPAADAFPHVRDNAPDMTAMDVRA